MDKAKLTDYIKWLLSQLDEISSNDVDKGEVKTMLLSIIGEMYKHRDTNRIGSVQEKETEDDILDPVPKTINITGIDGRGYVEILNAYEFKDYWRYDLNILDNHGDAISIYVPKNEPRSAHKETER